MFKLALTAVVLSVTVLALTVSSECRLKKRALKTNVQKYQKQCLGRGFESSIGCENEPGTLSKKKRKACDKIEQKLKNCEYACPIDRNWSDYGVWSNVRNIAEEVARLEEEPATTLPLLLEGKTVRESLWNLNYATLIHVQVR